MKEAAVLEFPSCDFCKTGSNIEKEASYDGVTVFGKWAFMCDYHFERYGVGLGLGVGQKLTLKGE
ncbi:MAG: hypothetical protein WCS33_00030 [Candidatus Caldatribacteriota bacterium]